MQEIEYLIYLSPRMQDRLRVSAQKDKGVIWEFVVQYEILVNQTWSPVIRYDTAHGFAHRDLVWPSGRVEKQPLFFDNYNMAFTYASLDLKANWAHYRRAYEQEMGK